MELDTKTLSSATIEGCRESEKWLEKMVAQNAPSSPLPYPRGNRGFPGRAGRYTI